MEITVGIDVSKARLDVHVHPTGESFALGNDEAGVEALCQRLGRLEGVLGIGSRPPAATSGWRWPHWPRRGWL